jgi:uncharacterized membrane protein
MEILNGILELPFLSGCIFTVTALITHLFPPKKINDLYGYRTSASKKSQAHWDFAQQYSTKIMAASGVVLLLISLLGIIIPVAPKVRLGLGIVLMLAVCAVLLVFTENALRKKFPNP